MLNLLTQLVLSFLTKVFFTKTLTRWCEKGAFDETAAEAKFTAWTEANEARISGKKMV
ncbi:hypothetical protein KUH03_21865 [Sphingobacterium sp. E70]|nr:hypothetical protein [Sphingobacterium sp. E70]ULT22143.1 hypothetical protein KUH03_21865 [Sphingobacterium sp. E70]